MPQIFKLKNDERRGMQTKVNLNMYICSLSRIGSYYEIYRRHYPDKTEKFQISYKSLKIGNKKLKIFSKRNQSEVVDYFNKKS